MHRQLNLAIGGGPVHWRTHRIMELCEFLTGGVLEPLFEREGVRWNRQFMDFFSFDNECDPLEPTGTILFRVPPLFAGREGELEQAILKELGRLKIKTAPFEYQKDPQLPNHV